MEGNKTIPVTRVLLVDDHEPFRRFIRSILTPLRDLLVVAEAGDGTDAVTQCVDLQPDLVLMDIGLPGLNGIEAARRVRELVPAARIIFLTLENSTEIVHEALSLGAAAYVIKAQTASDLIPAINAARDGRHFVSACVDSGNSRGARKSASVARETRRKTYLRVRTDAANCHQLHFCSDDQSLSSAFALFIGDALKGGKAILALMAEHRRRDVVAAINASGVDADAAIQSGRLAILHCAEVLNEFMVNGRVDQARLLNASRNSLEALTRKNRGVPVVACGECAPNLWAQGNQEAAIQVERAWDDLARRYDIEVRCFYLRDYAQRFQDQTMEPILALHSSETIN